MRLLGVNIPDQKQIRIALTYIYGIGFTSSDKILAETKINPGKLAKDLNQDEQSKIKTYVEKTHRIEGELKQLVRQNVLRLKELKTYRGVRHMRRLPVRGQRTRTNSRTVRGNVRKTAGSGKRKVDLK
ncbi:MAG: 30S ribosomal protein S13 [Candidatus Liptonbacteria bacterium]|nr:30S ribosomal protein S13 [Candidatus Liptonbacteria bacterium]